MKRISTIFLMLGLCSCSLLQRSPESGYSNGYGGSDLPNIRRERQLDQREQAKQELGMANYSSLNDEQRQAVENRTELRRLEKALESKREREQYFRVKPYLLSDRDRIEFLRIPSYESRQRWLDARGIMSNANRHAPEVQELIDINDITVGMPKQAVRESWGEPEEVEVAGNPLYGNERWQYKEQLASQDGYQTETRLVYFEGGRVVGWEKY